MKITKTISRSDVPFLISEIPFYAFFGVVFTKIDGSTRKMNCNRSISVGLNNKKKPKPILTTSLQVYDVNVKKLDGTKGGFRQVNLETVSEINFDSVKYIVL